MNNKERHYVRKYEALDFGMGTYSSRTLKRDRYHQRDFLDYLSTLELPLDSSMSELLQNESQEHLIEDFSA